MGALPYPPEASRPMPSAPAAIAQVNIARMRWDASDPRMAGFVDNIARMNALAERFPGFLWRMTDGSADRLFALGDPRMTVTVSAWESVEAVRAFAHRTVHARFLGRRAEWFEPLAPRPHLAFWPIAPGAWPTAREAMDRLALLEAEGPSARVFGFEGPPAPA